MMSAREAPRLRYEPASNEENGVLKWRLLLTTLPIVAAVLIAKILLSSVLHFDGWIDFTDTALVLTGGIFLIGFMLAGTMADYKESEKLPAELAAQLESLEDSLEHAVAVNATPIQRSSVIGVHRSMAQSIYDWLMKRNAQEDVFDSLHRVALTLQDLEKQGVHGGAVGKMTGDVDKIRKIVSRLSVISRTGFLAAGYALLEMLIVLIICLLLISSFRSLAAEAIVIPFVTLIYVYMYRLIRDIDDPFEYSPDGQRGTSEVALFPLTEYLARLDSRIAEGATDAGRASFDSPDVRRTPR